jgi:hypothetical protein
MAQPVPGQEQKPRISTDFLAAKKHKSKNIHHSTFNFQPNENRRAARDAEIF